MDDLAMLNEDLSGYLIDHLYGTLPRVRQRSHWAMSPEWHQECQSLPARAYDRLDDGRIYVFGIPVTVTDGGGFPHLEAD